MQVRGGEKIKGHDSKSGRGKIGEVYRGYGMGYIKRWDGRGLGWGIYMH